MCSDAADTCCDKWLRLTWTKSSKVCSTVSRFDDFSKNQNFELFVARDGNKTKKVNLKEDDINALCQKAMQIFLEQPMLLELEAPLKICGIHKVGFFAVSYYDF